MFILLPYLLLNGLVDSSQYQDCTNQFKNQIAMFEYLYYPGWWSTPGGRNLGNSYKVDLEFANDIPDAKANKNLHFKLHDCGQDTLCIEVLKSTWNGYYLGFNYGYMLNSHNITIRAVQHTTLYDVKQHPSYKNKIHCTSCQPETDIYHDCQIYNVESHRYWYTDDFGEHGLLMLSQGWPNWFQWRIVSPPTREFWTVSNHFENCNQGSEESPAYASFQTSISNSVSTTHTVEEKIEFGLEAIPFLKALSGTSTTTVTWSTANVRAWAESVTSTIGSAGTKSKMVKPGMKWVIEQVVGEAAFTTIKANKFRFCDIPCSSNSTDCSGFV